jgi:hypothetical protein
MLRVRIPSGTIVTARRHGRKPTASLVSGGKMIRISILLFISSSSHKIKDSRSFSFDLLLNSATVSLEDDDILHGGPPFIASWTIIVAHFSLFPSCIHRYRISPTS